MDENTVLELALEERKFLHEISNKLAVADGMAAKVLRLMESSNADEDLIRRQKKALKAIKDQIELVKKRRFILHERSNVKSI
ncbi:MULTISPECIES: hypothetical protein [unclassified Halobacteriovorax]|uniref:hypothetical protein n=1 Tax=unclassified Halobacteriovorax TaxID=2639665 RepID=UPI000EA122DC|nr:hypothetical protein [Halobacteriovorax sp. BALOs_7]AYF43190.1 hypothetical protein BALOs_0169 [Halobacteriovorax sp. BALOs_7]